MTHYFDYELRVSGRPGDDQAELKFQIDTDYRTAQQLLEAIRAAVAKTVQD